ncbi:MAG: excinuclease ABC subunit UvrA [Pirellulaceae bacterium]|nr:excinuclease ABC subunit UvrA [Pirellulaceae bacterium]
MISLRGVRVHNLKNVDVDIPRSALVAICGLSGSGKTSLALDTLYAEGQRRYIESFSTYTRQFLQRFDKPDYDRIDGLTPALAVTRSGAPRGNRSTVGTSSQSLDYLRLLFSKVAQLFCYGCGRSVQSASPQSVAAIVQQLPSSIKLMLACSVSWQDADQRSQVLADLQQQGFVRLIAGQQIWHLSDDRRADLAKALPKSGGAWVVVDRLRGGMLSDRSVPSLETAFALGDGSVRLWCSGDETLLEESLAKWISPATRAELSIDNVSWLGVDFATRLICPACDIDYPSPEPQLFNFNSPLGACPTCEGFGDTVDLDMSLIVPDPRKSIADGAIAPWNTPSYAGMLQDLLQHAKRLRIPVDVPFHRLTPQQVSVIRDGNEKLGYGGLAAFFAWLERKKYKMHVRVFLSRWRSYHRCSQCQGARLKKEALAYQVAGHNLAQLCNASIVELTKLFGSLNEQLDSQQRTIARQPWQQLLARLQYLQLVGLGYLSLDRPLRTLSGGEAQRAALTAALGSSLVNMLYVLDEPSVGLHPHDVEQLGQAISNLTCRGNTVVMVEHEEALLERAEWIIEVGPGAGSAGGRIVYSGPRSELLKSDTLTGSYLSGSRVVPIPAARRQPRGSLKLTGCRGNNLQNLDVEFPLGVLCLVTGVSGSGKSSLVQDTLHGAISNRLTTARLPTLPYDSLLGLSHVDDCILVDQAPISRSPRSNPVTYVRALDEIRRVFAETTEAKIRGFSAGHFSFNGPLGRCPKCEGDGVLQIDMQFLADVFRTCPDCGGTRYRHEILQVRYRDHHIADVLQLTVQDALHFFRGQEKVRHKLSILASVGLDYLQLGQPATTLSAGEAQRLKLASFLATATKRKTLFILDEPTTGLHTHDIVQLLDCFDALLEADHSLIVVEHNLHLMAAADYIIDLGPGAAEQGGRIVASGPPAHIANHPQSITGRYLRQAADQGRG